MGTFNVLEAIKRWVPDTLVAVVGSSAVYGPREANEMPLKELSEYRPTSMYAVSKIGEESLGYFYYSAHGMRIIRVRPFNMTGPGKLYDACSDFTRGVIEVERGMKKELEVGNLETTRDFTDGRDAAKALWNIAESGEHGAIYNLCSGKGWMMKDILELAIKIGGREIKYIIAPDKMRQMDDPIYIGDNTRLRSLGWQPGISMSETLKDMLNWWRERI
jgi:GDP-4-dehydro-6-deoxy-D-mannose reductase